MCCFTLHSGGETCNTLLERRHVGLIICTPVGGRPRNVMH